MADDMDNEHQVPGALPIERTEASEQVQESEVVDEKDTHEETKPDVVAQTDTEELLPAVVVGDDITVPSLPPLPPNTHAPDSPTTQLISTLRHQISLLTDQSTQLNSKLIASVSRVGDLEDSLEHATTSQAERDRKIQELEVERAQWEESMNTGLLVEKATVRDEMQRLVEGMAEEERRRGSAEEGRHKVEQEIDDLSASLFEQANHMVAAERLHRIQAESRLRAAEENLAVAETAVQSMQQHLQSMPSLLLPPPDIRASKRRYMANHLPRTEFNAFLAHLRVLKPHSPAYASIIPVPTITLLASQPFLARTITEDHDPTLRLDFAPDLNWLSRRSLNAAILAGDLAIEPVSVSSLLASPAYASYSGDIGCSMCGKAVFSSDRSTTPTIPPPYHPTRSTSYSSSNRFSLKPFFNSPTARSPSASPIASPSRPSSVPPVYIFRINSATEKESKMYPLCHTGWCLARLRTTCELWRFVRSGILDVVWKGEDGWVVRSRQSMPAKMPFSVPPLPPRSVTPVEAVAAVAAVEETSAPELPPRKRSGWGLGFTFGSTKSSGSAATDSEPATPNEDGDEETKRLTGPPDGDIQKVEMEQGDAEATVPLPIEPAISPSTSHEPEFSTPKGLSPEREEANLPVEVGADADADVDVDADADADADAEVHPVETVKEMPTAEETPEQSPAINDLGEGQQTVDISSPRASMDGGVPEEAAGTAETPADTATPLPPPVPRRASRRRIDAAASVSAPIEDVEASRHEETAADEIDPLDETDHSPTTPNAPAPPRLPPRSHTRTTSTNTVIAGSPVTPTGKNQWVEGDGWEAKTWKELVRLKEEMWMARMGLVDSVE